MCSDSEPQACKPVSRTSSPCAQVAISAASSVEFAPVTKRVRCVICSPSVRSACRAAACEPAICFALPSMARTRRPQAADARVYEM
jgi:hypothetical protein